MGTVKPGDRGSHVPMEESGWFVSAGEGGWGVGLIN